MASDCEGSLLACYVILTSSYIAGNNLLIILLFLLLLAFVSLRLAEILRTCSTWCCSQYHGSSSQFSLEFSKETQCPLLSALGAAVLMMLVDGLHYCTVKQLMMSRIMTISKLPSSLLTYLMCLCVGLLWA